MSECPVEYNVLLRSRWYFLSSSGVIFGLDSKRIDGVFQILIFIFDILDFIIRVIELVFLFKRTIFVCWVVGGGSNLRKIYGVVHIVVLDRKRC